MNTTSPEEADEHAALSTDEATKNPVKKVLPLYPPIARAARIQGDVTLQLLIDKHGKVAEIGVVSGHPMLQQAALDAVRQWVYKPYKINGKAASMYTAVKVTFVFPQ